MSGWLQDGPCTETPGWTLVPVQRNGQAGTMIVRASGAPWSPLAPPSGSGWARRLAAGPDGVVEAVRGRTVRALAQGLAPEGGGGLRAGLDLLGGLTRLALTLPAPAPIDAWRVLVDQAGRPWWIGQGLPLEPPDPQVPDLCADWYRYRPQEGVDEPAMVAALVLVAVELMLGEPVLSGDEAAVRRAWRSGPAAWLPELPGALHATLAAALDPDPLGRPRLVELAEVTAAWAEEPGPTLAALVPTAGPAAAEVDQPFPLPTLRSDWAAEEARALEWMAELEGWASELPAEQLASWRQAPEQAWQDLRQAWDGEDDQVAEAAAERLARAVDEAVLQASAVALRRRRDALDFARQNGASLDDLYQALEAVEELAEADALVETARRRLEALLVERAERALARLDGEGLDDAAARVEGTLGGRSEPILAAVEALEAEAEHVLAARRALFTAREAAGDDPLAAALHACPWPLDAAGAARALAEVEAWKHAREAEEAERSARREALRARLGGPSDPAVEAALAVEDWDGAEAAVEAALARRDRLTRLRRRLETPPPAEAAPAAAPAPAPTDRLTALRERLQETAPGPAEDARSRLQRLRRGSEPPATPAPEPPTDAGLSRLRRLRGQAEPLDVNPPAPPPAPPADPAPTEATGESTLSRIARLRRGLEPRQDS